MKYIKNHLNCSYIVKIFLNSKCWDGILSEFQQWKWTWTLNWILPVVESVVDVVESVVVVVGSVVAVNVIKQNINSFHFNYRMKFLTDEIKIHSLQSLQRTLFRYFSTTAAFQTVFFFKFLRKMKLNRFTCWLFSGCRCSRFSCRSCRMK